LFRRYASSANSIMNPTSFTAKFRSDQCMLVF
jgi:hypothetical protein